MGTKLRNNNYIAIADWMLDLGLNTRELLTFAIIYGFSQDGESCFSGSLSYLALWLNVSRRDNVMRYLKSLEEKGLIIKEKKTNSRNTWCEYRTVIDKGIVKNADYVIISPWMIESGIKDKDLILYALIYGYSRKESNSYFTGTNDYMARWLCINKAHLNRYLSPLINSGLVELTTEKHLIKYRAIIPRGNSEKEDSHQIEYTITTTKDGELTKLSTPPTNVSTDLTKLSINNLDNNLVKNDAVVRGKKTPTVGSKKTEAIDQSWNSFGETNINGVLDVQRFVNANAIEIKRINEANRSKELSEKIIKFFIDACDDYGLENTKIINKLPDSDFKKLFRKAEPIVNEDPGTEKMISSRAVLKSQISKCIRAYQNKERN